MRARLLTTLLLAAAGLTLGACGGGRHAHTGAGTSAPRPAARPSGIVTPRGPALGLTEDNAALLRSAEGPSDPAGASAEAGSAGSAFQTARRALTALHPTYIRLLVDWAAVQPDPNRPPALEAPVSGCARQIGPCAPYAGVRGELEAIASQQRAAAAGGAGNAAGSDTGASFQVVVQIFDTPVWAAQPPAGCEAAAADASSRPPGDTALGAYRTLVRSLLALATREGVALQWWSPWNEPNDPVFLSPQHVACTASSPSFAAASYARLVRALAAELRADGSAGHVILGELAGYPTGSSHRTSIAQFVADMPADALCLGSVWSVHAYASHGAGASSGDPVRALEKALDARGACGRAAPIWVTEAGAGAPHPGKPRPPGAAEELAGCRALAAQLSRWYRDPRVGAVFQYSFRDDPAFPVGLASADLSRLYPTYRLWLEWSKLRSASRPPPAPAAACA
jgi:hypothetical protein